MGSEALCRDLHEIRLNPNGVVYLARLILPLLIRRHLRRRLEHFGARLPCPGPIPGHPIPSGARRARGHGAGPAVDGSASTVPALPGRARRRGRAAGGGGSGILIGKLKQIKTKSRRKIKRNLGLSSFIFHRKNCFCSILAIRISNII